MNKAEKEIVELMTTWKDEIKTITSDYNAAIAKVDQLRGDYEQRNNKFYFRLFFSPIGMFIIGTLVVIIALAFISNYTNWCEINIKYPDGFEVKECTE